MLMRKGTATVYFFLIAIMGEMYLHKKSYYIIISNDTAIFLKIQ